MSNYLSGVDIDALKTFRPFEQQQPEQGDVSRGFQVAFGQTVPIMKGMVGLAGATMENVVGEGGIATATKNWGLQGYQTGMAKLDPLQRDTDSLTTAWDHAKEGDVGALIDFAQYGIGYALGQAGETAAMAFLGGVAGAAAAPEAAPLTGAAGAVAGIVGKGGVKTLATNLIEKAVVKEANALMAQSGGKLVAEQAVKDATKTVARNIASTGSLLGYGAVQELGSIYPEAEAEAAKRGEKLDGGDIARIWATGLAAGGIEGLTDKLGIDAALGKVRIPGAGRAGSGAVGALGGMAVEGGTEAVQTAIERYGAQQDLSSPEAIHDYINSAGLGAIGGGMFGGASGALHFKKAAREQQNSQAMTDLMSAGSVDDAVNAAMRAADTLPDIVGDAQDAAARSKDLFKAKRADAAARARAEMDRAPDAPSLLSPKHYAPLALPDPSADPSAWAVGQDGLAYPTWGGNEEVAGSADLMNLEMRRGERETMKTWSERHAPMGLEDAIRIVHGAEDRGIDWSVVPHLSGEGWMVLPDQWLTDDTRAKAKTGLREMLDRINEPLPARQRSAEQPADRPANELTPDQLVNAEVERRRATGGLADRMFARDFDAGRITTDDVMATIQSARQPSPDERLAAAAAQAQPSQDDVTSRLTAAFQQAAQAPIDRPWNTGSGIVLPDSMRVRSGSFNQGDRNEGQIWQRQGRRQEGLLTEPGAAGLQSPAAPAVDLDSAAHEAATSPRNDLPEPTQAQKEAGNYKKGHVSWNGLDISIENPAGSTRSGVDQDGKPWSVEAPAHYGYVRRTTGADGDHVDVYIGPKPDSTRAYVVDQLDAKTGKFDEHKVILGAETEAEARALYEAGFNDGKGPERAGSVTEMSVDQLKEWLGSGNTTTPVNRRLALKNMAQRGHKPAGRRALVRGSEALAYISERLGGIDPSLLADLSERRRVEKVGTTGRKVTFDRYDNPPVQGQGPLFREGGADLVTIARALEAGEFLPAGSVDADPAAAAERAKEIVRAELRGHRKNVQTLHVLQPNGQAVEKSDASVEKSAAKTSGPAEEKPAATAVEPEKMQKPAETPNAPAVTAEPTPVPKDESAVEPRPEVKSAQADAKSAGFDVMTADEDSIKALAGRKITMQVLVEDTGKEAAITLDAEAAVRRMRERVAAVEQLIKCLG